MDMWGVGCVFFEVLSLYPLFPGTNELDQVNKIHQVLGTPPPETLAKLKKHSNSHIDFNFPHKEAQPMQKLLAHCGPDCIAYDATICEPRWRAWGSQSESPSCILG